MGPIVPFSVEVPVTYDFFYQFTVPPNETELARLEGMGGGTAEITFAVDNSFGPDPVYVVSNADYSLGAAVPEPTSFIVWGLLALVAAAVRLRRSGWHGAVDA